MLRLAFCCSLAVAGLCAAETSDAALRALISRADLHYPKPVARSEDGLPLGNGRMGSLVWTSPTALKFQINRNDVQSVSGTTHSFPERNTDYMGGCGFVDIDLGGAGPDIFVAENCPQHLSVYDGIATLEGRDVTARVVAAFADDVMAIEIDDRRSTPQPIAVDLRMLRGPLAQHFGGDLEKNVAEHIVAVRTRNHVAASQLHVRGDRIALTQRFTEGDYAAQSAVAIRVVGRPVRPHFANETTVRLVAPAARGRFVVLVASAAALNGTDPILDPAFTSLDGSDVANFPFVAGQTAEGWHQFWAQGSLALHSADGVADYVADQYHYFLYLMSATSRSRFPTKFNGMLWNTAGDLRTWGAQHWFANLSCLYEALFAANRLELLDPMFAMYSGMADASATAARQEWGSEGLYIPETVWFDGLAKLPDDIAAEMRELYLMRKPWSERSARFMAFAQVQHPHSSRWNWWGGGSYVAGQWTPVERGNGPYGPVSHILGTTAKVAYLYWRRYEFAPDRAWLRTHAYPILKGAAEFYRHFPNLQPEADGRLHMHHTNSNESVQDVRDSDEDLAAMRGLFAAAARAAEILDVDPELRTAWRDALARLAPLPTTADADALKPAGYDGPRVFVRGRMPVVNGRGFTPDGNSLPQWFFDLCNLDSSDAATLAAANATFDRAMLRGLNDKTPVGVLSKLAIAGTTLGRVDATRFLVPNQMRGLTAEREGVYQGGRPLANRLALREGAQAFDAQRLGRAAEALQLALLNSTPPAPAAEPAIRLFAAWPPEWDATFTLRARGGFVITATQKAGTVESVEVVSEFGVPLRLHNPWGEAEFAVERADGKAERVRGAVVTLATTQGERLRLRAR